MTCSPLTPDYCENQPTHSLLVPEMESQWIKGPKGCCLLLVVLLAAFNCCCLGPRHHGLSYRLQHERCHPPFGRNVGADFFDNEESANAEQCVYGNISTRCIIPKPTFSVVVPPWSWRKSTLKSIGGCYFTCFSVAKSLDEWVATMVEHVVGNNG